MSRLIRGVLWALALPSLYAGIATLLPSPGPAAAILAVDPGPIDRPLHLIGADFNRDGYDDLAIANFRGGTITILINQKDGTFAPEKDSPFSVGPATIATPSAGPLFLATGDFDPEDDDGDAVTNDVDNCPNVYNPIGTAGVQPDTGSLGVGDACRTLTTVDSDGDGVPDYDPVTHVLDNCPLTYNPLQEPEVAAGLDGDCTKTTDNNVFLYGVDGQCGTSDDPVAICIAGGNKGKVCLNNGDCPGSICQTRVGAACSRSPDLAIVETTSGGGSILGIMRVRVNDGQGGLRSRNSLQLSVGPVQTVIGDFNGDGKQDMVVSNSGTNALLWLTGTADAEFGPICAAGASKGKLCGSNLDCPGSVCQQTLVMTTGNQPAGLAAGDFDGDGALDVAVANRADKTVGLYINSGNALPKTESSTLSTIGRGPSFLLAGPAKNGDVCAMLVVLDQDLQVCSGGTNDGKFCITDLNCPGGGTCQIAGADDGKIETFVPSICAPGATMSPVQTIDLGPGHRPINGALTDFDGDGKADLAVADFKGNQVLVYKGKGDGTFDPAIVLPGGPFASPSALAVLNYDPNNGPNPDLAVLGFASNRVDLIHNDSIPGLLSFTVAPTTPVSPWANVSAMSIFAADASDRLDLVMLVASPPRVDVLSGTGETFRVLPPEPLSKPTAATGMGVADLRQDGISDMLVLDGPGGTVMPVITELTGAQTERPSVAVGANPVQASVGPLALHGPLFGDDYDRDGVPNGMDNCPTRYNPPNCPVNDPIGHPECFVDIACQSTAPGGAVPNDCSQKNAAGQCDSDGNGVGDQCQVLGALACKGGANDGLPCTLDNDCSPGVCLCPNLDTDQDTVPDYDQFSTTTPKKIDNCPWTPNTNQSDVSNNGLGNGIGDLCDDTTCTVLFGIGTCASGPKKQAVCATDADCEAPVNDIVVVNKGDGSLSLLTGDTSGTFRPAPGTWSALSGFSNPVAALVGHFSFNCFTDVFNNTTCTQNPQTDIVVAEQGNPGSGDDALKLFVGDGSGHFTAPSAPVAPQTALQGDPTALLLADKQKVCANPWVAGNDPRFRFERHGNTAVVAAIEPATSSIGVYLPSSEGLVPPPANPSPLPLASPPRDALFVDLNVDGIEDLVSLSSGAATPNITIFIGMGNGLFFTDPTFNPTDNLDGMTLLAAGNIRPTNDLTYPDVALFSSVDRAPIILTNVLTGRADVDGSGRVDGYDLAVLAHSFGAHRGENFTLLPDGTLDQTGTGATRVLVPSGCVLADGHDMPVGLVPCDRSLDPMTTQNGQCPGPSLYGLPVDINLDGQVDGTDLALLASLFGKSL